MNRTFAAIFLIGFFILLVLVIASFFIPFDDAAAFVYALFSIALFYFLWVLSRKSNSKKNKREKA